MSELKRAFGPLEWGILLLALALRIAIGLLTVGEPGGDAKEYVALGENLAAGHGFSLSVASPYVPTDWRMPAYPALIAAVESLGLGLDGLVVVNSLLGALGVAALLLIAGEVFGERTAPRLWVGVAAALYPSLVTYTGLAYAENLSVTAVAWFVYLAFFSSRRAVGSAWWLVGWFVGSSILILTRAEGVLLVAAGFLLTVVMRRIPVRIAVAMVLIAALAPAAWAVRNERSTGRFELVDPLNRDATLVLSVDDGDFRSPLYRRGARMAIAGVASGRRREDYHDAVVRHIRDALESDTGRVFSYKARSLINFPFTPVVWNWAAADDYSLSEAVQELDGRNAARVVWSVVLLVQYALAALGFFLWWRGGNRRYCIGIALYPALAFFLAIPFHSELRLWFAASFLLIVPAAVGARQVLERRGDP